ncbi:MAG: hypothetical protein JXR37_00060 [Kiritimatiellae bacterium]|nr:hypothetical protein [Kiritimatiellia bacterium]
MKTLEPILELPFGAHGGAECFFHDIDGDGRLEIITYQGPGVFGAGYLREREDIARHYPESVSVSAFRMDGARVWTWGQPNPLDSPYLSHSYECCVDCADIDGDGSNEVLLADGDRLVVLEGATGREKGTARLPADNFYILKALGGPAADGEAVVAMKNGEKGYEAWRYGEPVIGLNARLAVVWGPKAFVGGGHHILAVDLDGDGRNEYMTGYCAFKADGETVWTVDGPDTQHVDADAMHVDQLAVGDLADGRRVVALAGSDRLYAAQAGGKTLFVARGPHIAHVQGAAIGRFRPDSELQIACYNAPDGPMNLYDLAGTELWSVPAVRRWPLGEPAGSEGRAFHRNRPIVTLAGRRDWIGYADGGWPWALNGAGEREFEFAAPGNSRDIGSVIPAADGGRGDDLGFGFALQSVDVDQDGIDEAVIYNRRYLWAYSV